MIKREELTNPHSCMSRAKDGEMTFVLLSRDIVAPDAIRYWAEQRIARGKNQRGDAQISEAFECARRMEHQRNNPETVGEQATAGPACSAHGPHPGECDNRAHKWTATGGDAGHGVADSAEAAPTLEELTRALNLKIWPKRPDPETLALMLEGLLLEPWGGAHCILCGGRINCADCRPSVPVGHAEGCRVPEFLDFYLPDKRVAAAQDGTLTEEEERREFEKFIIANIGKFPDLYQTEDPLKRGPDGEYFCDAIELAWLARNETLTEERKTAKSAEKGGAN